MFNSFKELLANKSLKATPQRIAILNIINEHGHISVEDIYENLKDTFPTISLATIYKNVNSLVSSNILCEVNVEHSKVKYEINKKPHSHFICNNCKNIYDLYIDVNIKTDIGDIENQKIYLYGTCKNCL